MLKRIRLNFSISSKNIKPAHLKAESEHSVQNKPDSPLMAEPLYHHLIFHLQLLLCFAQGSNLVPNFLDLIAEKLITSCKIAGQNWMFRADAKSLNSLCSCDKVDTRLLAQPLYVNYNRISSKKL